MSFISTKEKQKVGDYYLGDLLGRGAYGFVYKGLHATTGDFVAIKKVDKTRLNSKTTSSVTREVELLKKLDHPSILKIYECMDTEEYLYLVLEFMENGSLVTVLEKFGPLPESLVIIYVYQALIGLKYLHENNVLHRDIKAANILINKDGGIKLADFGVASDINKDASARFSVVGTPYWMAPEAIELICPPCTGSDIWSIGSTTIELLTGQPPYFEMSPISAIFRIVQDPHPPVPTAISEMMTDFISKCFIKDPENRPSAQQLMSHPIFMKDHLQAGAKPSYKELKNTLKNIHKKPRKNHVSVLDYAPFTPPIPDTQVPSQENVITTLQDELLQLKMVSEKREEVIKKLSRENEDLRQKLHAQNSNQEKYRDPEAFYRDYFITLSMSVKINMNTRGKECRVDIKELLDLAKDEKVALHELVEWIPKQIQSVLKRKPKSKLIKQQ